MTVQPASPFGNDRSPYMMLDYLRTLLAKLITALSIGPASLRVRALLWLASATDNLEEKSYFPRLSRDLER
jgi:hypothetical protein